MKKTNGLKPKPKYIKRLRESLPPGFGVEVRKRLLLKGYDFSLGYINRTLNPDDKSHNELILDEVLAFLEEIKIKTLQKEEKILELTR